MKNLFAILAVVLFLTSCKEEAEVVTEETPVEVVAADSTVAPVVDSTVAPAE